MRACILALVAAFSVPVSAQASPRDFPTSDKPVIEDHYPQAVTQWPGGPPAWPT